MTILEFRTADLGRIVEHALAATDDRDGFHDDGSGAGLILVADPGGVYLMSNATPPLLNDKSHNIVSYALGGNPECDEYSYRLVFELDEDGRGKSWLCNWARMIRHISKSADSIRVKVEDGSAELLYDENPGTEPAIEETEK